MITSHTLKISKPLIPTLTTYTIAHAIIDTLTISVLFRNIILQPNILNTVNYILLYNVIAFGSQIFIGMISDVVKKPRLITMIGYLLATLSLICIQFDPNLSIIMAGLGNAFFHIGGGTISLNITPKHATAPGIFVAAGALGPTLGFILGNNHNIPLWPQLIPLLIVAITTRITAIPQGIYQSTNKSSNFGLVIFTLSLLFATVVIRSLIGSTVIFVWKSNIYLLLILTCAIIAGKAVSGYIADRFGWIKISIIALGIAAPLLAFAPNIPLYAIIGIFLFQMTMPITLTAIANLIPGKPGFAFGLPCLAILLGTFPEFLAIKSNFQHSWLIFFIIAGSGLLLFYALHFGRILKILPSPYSGQH
jgi:FSR family fosmidomycin resistance protein-like MFS transporter